MAKEKPVLIAKSRDRMPNHLFYATVRHFDKKNAVARKVLCELYLPDSHRGEIEIIFHPTAEQIPAFQFVPAVSLYARSRPARFVLRSDEIWHEGAQTGMQDGISFMYSCKGRASNLEIRNLLGQSKSNTLKAGTFWLTAGWPTFAPLFFAKVGSRGLMQRRASFSSSPVPTEIQDLVSTRRIHKSQAG